MFGNHLSCRNYQSKERGLEIDQKSIYIFIIIHFIYIFLCKTFSFFCFPLASSLNRMCSPRNVTSDNINLYSPVWEDTDVHTVKTQRCQCNVYDASEMEVYIIYLKTLYKSNSEDLSPTRRTLIITGYEQDGTVTTWYPTNNNIMGFKVIENFDGSVSILFVKERSLRKADFHLLLSGKLFSFLLNH